MTEGVLIAIVGAFGSAFAAYIAARGAIEKKSREEAIANAQREQRQQDQLEEIKHKLDIHNGYAEKLGDIQLDIAGIHKDIEYLRKQQQV